MGGENLLQGLQSFLIISVLIVLYANASIRRDATSLFWFGGICRNTSYIVLGMKTNRSRRTLTRDMNVDLTYCFM